MKNFYLKSLQHFSLTVIVIFLSQNLIIANYIEDGSNCFNANLTMEELQSLGVSNCQTAPVIICPSLHFGCPGESTHPSNTGWAIASPGDPNCIQPDVSYTDYVIQNSSCFYELHREWKATYSDDTNPWLYSDCTQIIILNDIDEPVIHNCPPDITVNMNSNCEGIASWTPPTATDNCGLLSLTSNYLPGDNFLPGVNLVVYTATDNCGNEEHCSFKVNVVGSCCNEIPDLTCPPDYIGCIGSSVDTSFTGVPIATVSDPNCPKPILSYVDTLAGTTSCAGSVIIHRTWDAKNPVTNVSSKCLQILTFSDNTMPTIINCLSDTIVEVANNVDSTAVNWISPIANDNCSMFSFLSNYSPGDTFPLGTTTVSYTAMDDCFNESTCSFNITVRRAICDTPPIINCPPKVVACVGSDIDPSVTGYATAVASDTLCGTPIVSYKDHVLVDGPCPGRKYIRRIWKAVDPNDSTLVSTCRQYLNLRDSRDPVISGCPSDILIMSMGNDSVAVSWTAPTATDNCGLESFTSTHNPGDKFPVGITQVEYLAIDKCGGIDICQFDIEIMVPFCSEPPTINCPPNVVACVGSDYSPDVIGYATGSPANMNCDDPIISYEDYFHIVGPCPGRLFIRRTWKATDPNDSLLFTTCLQTINHRDADAPVFSNCPSDITVTAPGVTACSGPASWTPPTATDNCGLASVTSNYNPGDLFVEGTTTIQYTAIDSCGLSSTCSFTVTVECEGCTTAPNIICPPDYTGCPTDDISPNVLGQAIASPGSPECLMPILTYMDDTITAGPCPGALEIDRIWTATDPGNWKVFSSCVQLIILEDTAAPYLSACPSDITVTANNSSCTATANWNPPVANDLCGIASMTSNYSSGDYFDLGTTIVTYTASDICGSEVSCSFSVTVECESCNQAPIINCPPNGWACPGSNYDPAIFGNATASNSGVNCGTPIISFSDLVVNTGPCSTAKIIERTWTARDPDNSLLESSCVQIISLEDNQAPVITNCPNNITVSGLGVGCHKYVTWNEPSYNDNCQTSSLTSNYTSGSAFYEGNTTVIYTATDACGNSSTCSFTVTVLCNNLCLTPPTLYCPSSASVCIGDDYSPASTGYPTAVTSDPNCPAPYVDYYDITMSTGPCNGQKEIKRRWRAYYPNYPNLDVTCDQWISVTDNSIPVFWDCPNNISVPNSNYTVSWTPPILTDDCSSTTVTSTHTPGSTFPPGVTTVTYYGYDACGNSAICSFEVHVGSYGNHLECPDDLIIDCDGNGGAYIDWQLPSYTGSCGSCINGAPIPGFVYMGEFNGHHYYCSTQPATWNTANLITQNLGGYLASINSQAENDFLSTILTLQSAYIGLNDINVEGLYQWANGEPVTYTNWYPGQPNNHSNQDHVEMLNNGQWNDQYSYKLLEYIMEVPCNSINQIAGPTKGSYVQPGHYNIEYELIDMCGVTSTCEFSVTVEGGIDMTCPDDIITQNNTNSSGMTVDWTPPSASSCCYGNCSAGSQIPGFIYMGQHDGSHYYCSIGTSTWIEAQASCASLGGYLTSINSQEENDFVAGQMLTSRAFIGLNDIANEGIYEWVNGDPFVYNNWYPNQPNNYNNDQHYVEMLSNGQWNDTYANFHAEYIMEIPGCLAITQIGGPAPGSVFYNNTTTTITYQATDGCGNVSTCSFDVTVEANNTCNSGGVNSYPAYINSVSLGSYKNVTGNNGGYFKNVIDADCFEIVAGKTYTLGLEPGFGSAIKDVFWKVWIDFNKDGDFEDSGEYIAYGSGSTLLSGMITIPSNIWNGQTTMRVAMKCGSYPTGPCEFFDYGETEDHCVNISGAFSANDDVYGRSTETEDVTRLYTDHDVDMIKVYPNPVSDYFNIDIGNIELVQQISLINSEGKKVKSLDINDLQRINIDELNGGLYIINIIYNDGRYINKNIIIL